MSGSLYRLNLIRDLRERERRLESKRRLTVILGLGCFGFFLLSLIYSGLTIMQMEHVLTHEQDKVSHLKQEYQKYTATRLIVDKSDIELLGGLQGRGVFWTRKLAAMAKYLPDNYSITEFRYEKGELHITGNGTPGPRQDQLLVLEGYVNHLRSDTSFADVFSRIFLNSVMRLESGGRVSFDISAVGKDWKAQ